MASLTQNIYDSLHFFSDQESGFEIKDDIPDKALAVCLDVFENKPSRTRALPREAVLWLIIGMAMFRGHCIRKVSELLKLRSESGGLFSSSALTQARNRIGVEPINALFEYTAQEWGSASCANYPWRGLSVYGIDGSCLRVPDTEENDHAFGRQKDRRDPENSTTSYPQVRLVALLSIRSRILAGVSLGPYNTSERTLASKLWPKLSDNSIVLLDRGFINHGLFYDLVRSGANKHFLCRAKKSATFNVIKKIDANDMIVELKIGPNERRADPSMPKTCVVRAIRYQRRGFQAQLLFTSLLDETKYPASDIRALYHERWEIELGFDEIKTDTLEREECLRSKSPIRVEQEIYGLLVAYNLIRQRMLKFAEKNALPPNQVSYRAGLYAVRKCMNLTFGDASFRTSAYTHIDRILKEFILPERKPRSYVRAVKIKMSNYARNRKRGSTRIVEA